MYCIVQKKCTRINRITPKKSSISMYLKNRFVIDFNPLNTNTVIVRKGQSAKK